MFKDTKGIIRIKRTNNDIQNTTQKTKNRATRTSVKPGWGTQVLRRERGSCFVSGTRRVTKELTNSLLNKGIFVKAFHCFFHWMLH
jgi:hypothetical protein